jgi:hypothetical protein
MTKFQQHQETRSQFHELIDQLKTQGVSVPELIEVMRNELTLLHLEDDRNAEASTKDLTRQGRSERKYLPLVLGLSFLPRLKRLKVTFSTTSTKAKPINRKVLPIVSPLIRPRLMGKKLCSILRRWMKSLNSLGLRLI